MISILAKSIRSALVVVAHPDDEVLGCGGTIVRLANAGVSVFCLALCKGVASRFRNAEDSSDALTKAQRARELAFQASCANLGIKQHWLLDFPDNMFDTVPLLELAQNIENRILDLEPELILTHHLGDLNIDHERTCAAVVTATRPCSRTFVPHLFSFEVPSSSEWSSWLHKDTNFIPNTFVDIRDVYATKLDSFKEYHMENRDFPHPRSEEAMDVISKRWGTFAGLNRAEAFMLVRSIS